MTKYKIDQLGTNIVTDPIYQVEHCLTLKEGHIAALLELIQVQRWATRWYGEPLDQDVRDTWVDDICFRLVNDELCAEQPEGEPTCTTLEAFHPAIQYWVNHPIYQPGYHPLPYTQPSWILGGGATIGTTENDAVLNPLALFGFADLEAILTAGVPSLTINFTGAGEVDIEFIQQVQGGMAWVFPDGNPLLGQVVDLEFIDVTDLASFEFLLTVIGLATGEQQSTTVHTVTFATPGPHTITCWFLPKGDVEPPFVGWGGGLRQVQLCGEAMEAIEMPITYDLACDTGVLTLLAGEAEVASIDLVECAQLSHFGAIRVQDCQIEQFDLLTDEWVAVSGNGLLPLDLSCQLEGHNLLLRPETNQPGLILVAEANKPGQNYLQVNSADGSVFGISHPGALYSANRQGNNATANIIQRFEMHHSNALNNFGGITSWDAQTAAGGPMRSIAEMATTWLNAVDAGRVGRQRWFVSGSGGQGLFMEFRRGTASQIGFFGATPVTRPAVGGLTVDTALASTIAALTGLGLITSTVALPSSAPVVALRQSDCHLQYSIDGTIWGDVPGAEYLPLSAAEGCNVVVLQNPGYLTVQRVGGSTEASNPVLRLQTMSGGAGSSIPMQVIMEGETDSTVKPLATIEARFLAEGVSNHRSGLDLNLYDYAGTRRIMSASAVTEKPAVAFLGATPAVRHHILIDNEEPLNMLDSLLTAMEAFGFINLTPCAPEVGDWAIEWKLEQLTALTVGCGSFNLNGYGPELNCPGAGDLTMIAQTSWGVPGDTVNIALVRVVVENVVIDNMTETIQWSISKNPGIGATVLESGAETFGTTGFAMEWEGDEDVSEVGFALSCGDTDFDFRVVSLRIEGYGVRPDLHGGSGCLD